ncbi:MAG: sigma-54-dependent Fis family transcriptional regulator [Deltaproteobacteria bacterium]|nr:sigma-54-dependent Fis family transcriptional regulator [Deltaproteobacteria bacterium]MBW1963121.1 sigma-54-dependent Fis family transcriptional regulator [Deltaproteobacteria bacterium]MBW1993239.1 sigma-54-dependent Fis family transcriptional regulator [Deltaproteobacteria bacterium]MBW2151241.1 sigma-54-dependent Fis family transcriptional regulator [Deltaproteobacteria bacterium]
MSTIWIIDDDDQLRLSFQKVLTEEGYHVENAVSGESCLAMIQKKLPDLIILDIRLPGMNGLETFQEIHKIDPKLPVIIMTAYGTTETAIEATKLGAFDYILKPFEIPDMLTLIEQAIEAGRFMRSSIEIDILPNKASRDALIGSSSAMQEVYKTIGRVSSTDATVLIRGESGTGKELVARAIYQHSLRSEKPFQVINCVAIPETLLESELFGYEKGAFTGATHRRIGKIELANHGTIFLDEIGDMPFSLQAKILRLIEEKNIERLGGRKTIPVDVRIIASTNRNLEAAIETGQFREDLYYRLKVITIWLPPLSQRRGDIALLAEYFLGRHAADAGIDPPGITKEALQMLTQHPWPGNVRELSNTIQKALIFNRGAPLSPVDIHHVISERRPGSSVDDEKIDNALKRWIKRELNDPSREHLFDECMDRYARLLIAEALKLAGGNRSRAAKLLGLSRPTLHSKIEKYGLKLETTVKDEDM